MPKAPPRFCIFGDSHYACLKLAQVRGLVDTAGVEVEHWGHVGRRFMYLEFRDGGIHPTDDFTAQRFAKFNEKGRRFLPAADFDAILVMGARSYLLGPFEMLLRAKYHGPHVSGSLRRRVLSDALQLQMGYRFAMGLAATGTARVLMAPTSFPTEGHATANHLTPEMAAAAPEARSEIWDAAVHAAAEDGVTLIPQPEETVVNGMMTSAAYAVDGYEAKPDYAHRNAAYGALILTPVLDIVRGLQRRG